jgi:hypothetical protein
LDFKLKWTPTMLELLNPPMIPPVGVVDVDDD